MVLLLYASTRQKSHIYWKILHLKTWNSLKNDTKAKIRNPKSNPFPPKITWRLSNLISRSKIYLMKIKSWLMLLKGFQRKHSTCIDLKQKNAQICPKLMTTRNVYTIIPQRIKGGSLIGFDTVLTNVSCQTVIPRPVNCRIICLNFSTIH